MCNNAMTYNHQDTIYYKAARKLLHHGMKILSPEKIKPLRSVLPFMSDITSEQVGFDISPEDESEPEILEDDLENEQQVDEKIKSKEPKEMPKYVYYCTVNISLVGTSSNFFFFFLNFQDEI